MSALATLEAPVVPAKPAARTVLLLASSALSLTLFRGPLIRTMVEAGHRVIGCAPDPDPSVTDALAAMGARFEHYPLERTGTNPLADLRTVVSLVRLFRRLRPDVVLAYTQKPMIYGGIAARGAGVPAFFPMVTGLGYVFTDGDGPSRRLLRTITRNLFRIGLRRAEVIFFFNPDDASEFRRCRIVNGTQRLVRVNGSGIDLGHYRPAPLPAGPPTFLLIARLLYDKGIREYVAAARALRVRHPEARFRLLGPFDPNPAAIKPAEVEAWVAEGSIEYLGETRDVRPHLAGCTVYVLPSYREGVPRTVLEAMATGRPVVTTDAPGCRETVVPGESGILVPPRDVTALTAALERFILEPTLAEGMGRAALRRARTHFEVGAVNAVLLHHLGLG